MDNTSKEAIIDKYEQILKELYELTKVSLSYIDQIQYLTDRPCSVCKNHTDTGCKAWTCPFDGLKEDGNADRD